MNYIHNQREIRVDWSIYKGSSGVLEDFSRAYLRVFLIGPGCRYAIEPTVSSNSPNIRLDIPKGLPEGVYILEAIWGKNWMLDDEKFNPTKRPLHSRDLSRAKTPAIFALTSDAAEENIYTSTGTAVVKVRSNVATYGYDGLDAYQMAVMSGRFFGSEDEWVDQLGDHDMSSYYKKSQIDARFGDSFIVWRSDSDDEPGADSLPESGWSTNEERNAHVGDVYLNSDGLCWEYRHTDGVGYWWKPVSDAYLIAALELAKKKCRCFTGTYGEDTLTGEYSAGDIWTNATYGETYTNDLLVCTHNGRWESLDITHWQPAGSFSAALKNFINGTYQQFVNKVTKMSEGRMAVQLVSFASDGVTKLSTYNAGGDGCLAYYYPSGNVMRRDVMTYDLYGNATGVRTVYYNDDAENTERWYIDENGNIVTVLSGGQQ